MARKQSNGEGESAPSKQGRFVRLELTTEDHILLRKVAAFEDMSMAEFSRQAVERAIAAAAEQHGLLAKKGTPSLKDDA